VQADHPYLGPAFEFLERARGTAPWVTRVHCFNFAATLSHGQISGDIPAVSIGAERLANGVAGALLAEDYERIWQRMTGWSNPELRGDEYTLSEDITPFLASEPAEAKA
jgi:hypothetical protein